MKERPILFSGAMVRAILEGRKTQTRRVVIAHRSWASVHTVCDPSGAADPWAVWFHYPDTERVGHLVQCPYGVPGDRLWVRESFNHFFAGQTPSACVFLADAGTSRWRNCPSAESAKSMWPEGWKPSIHMPRWASRITLEITDIRVERVQDISEQDARSEGAECYPEIMHADEPLPEHPYRNGFLRLWDSINAKRGFGWDANPWVWAITFRRTA